MNNILIYSDLHINQSSAKECIMILEEIGMLANKYNCDTLINLGDTFDTVKPSSLELDIFSTFINRLKNKKHIIIAADSHESTTQEESIVNHFGILNNMVTVVKEYKNSTHLYCGHFSIKESSSNYDSKLSKEAFKNYLYVFLGHVHSYQMIKPNICHIGSSRWVNFDEAKDKHKVVALISDYAGDKEEIHFLGLKSPIPMVELYLEQKMGNNPILDPQNEALKGESFKIAPTNPLNSRQNQAITDLIIKLDKLDSKNKVKIKIMDFPSFREFLPFCQKYYTKFETFKYETCFNVIKDLAPISAKNETINFKESLLKWLENQKIDKTIKEILQKEIE